MGPRASTTTGRPGRRSAVPGRLRGRLPRLSDQRGDTLIEVAVSALLLIIVSLGTITAMTAFGRSASNGRQHATAEQVAQQDEDHLRGLQVSDLQSLNRSFSVTADGQTFTVFETAVFVSDSSGTQSCSASGTGSADYLKTTSTVVWGVDTATGKTYAAEAVAAPTGTAVVPARNKVTEESLITPPVSGSIVAQVLDQNASPLSGVTIQVTGGSATVPSQITDSNGCAVFAGLPADTYTITATKSGYVDTTPTTTPSQQQTVVVGSTASAAFEMAPAASVSAVFRTTQGGTTISASSDQYVIAQNGLASPHWIVAGTQGSYSSAGISSPTLFPFTSAYQFYAGSCTSDNPATVSGSSDSPVSLILTAGVSNQPITLVVPTIALTVTNNATNPNGTTGTTNPTVVSIKDTGCGDVIHASVQSAAPTQLYQVPVPYGAYSVCAQWAVHSGFTTTQKASSATVTNNQAAGSAAAVGYASSANGSCP
jgi:Tfp pilus assembly protein PilV